MNYVEIGTDIRKKCPEASAVLFVGCGASMSELYPGKYFLEHNAKKLKTGLYTANEFFYSVPSMVGPDCIVVTCSLSGTTPETVRASKYAMELGATVVSVTKEAGSPLAANSHYQVIHGFEKNYAAKTEKMTNVLGLACELLHQYEGYAHYEDMQKGIANIYDLIEERIPECLPKAKAFAEAHKDMDHLFTLSSGVTYQTAYSLSMFLLMEMQWIKATHFHNGEFFHGPFELVEKDVPYFLFMNEGPTRAMDERALDFLKRFDADITILDAKELGLGERVPATVVEYFNAPLLTGVLRIYAEQLAVLREHPLLQRRYMWHLNDY